MEKSFEKSEAQADIIRSIQMEVMVLDVEYCREISKDMMEQASRQETMAILNPSHPQAKNDILRMKATALSTLCDYVDTLRRISEMERELKSAEGAQAEIKKLFM